MAQSILFFAFISCFLLFLLYYESLAQNKVPIPEGIYPLGPEYCVKYGHSPVSKVPACSNGSKATQSPCPLGCMPEHDVVLGHTCDHYLWRFTRLAWDDSKLYERRWMGGKILGAKVKDKTADYEFKGKCKFMCPAMMCIMVEQHPDLNKAFQWVDMTKFDCVPVRKDPTNVNDGVCTCGYKWSQVDPANAGRLLHDTLRLVLYNRTIGLDRRLVFDEKTGKCAAERYGHCSYNWPENKKNFSTPCYSRHKDIECVNRTVGSIRNFKTKLGLWYGICDSRLSIDNPFAKASRVSGANVIALLLTAITLKIRQVVNH